jgi:hypothetical protein
MMIQRYSVVNDIETGGDAKDIDKRPYTISNAHEPWG